MGHGIGKDLHELPDIPNYGKPNKGPMINQGSYHIKCLSDGWTIVTTDGKNSAHYEHTIAITEDEPFILTSL